MNSGCPGIPRHPQVWGQVVAAHPYLDEGGHLLYTVCRFQPKTFRPCSADGRWGLKTVRRVLYRLPELLAASPTEPVFICEGEKDADRLATLGFIATTCPEGARSGTGGKAWDPAWSRALEGRRCFLLEDNDPKGREHTRATAAALAGTAKEVRVVSLPGLNRPGKDGDSYVRYPFLLAFVLRCLPSVAGREG